MRGRSTVGRDALNVLMLVRFQPPQLGSTNETEVIRPDEEPVLKTGRGTAVVGSSPTTSAEKNARVPGVIGSTAGSNPVGQGSSPWGHALSEPSLTIWAHRPIAGRRLRTPKIPVQTRVGPLEDTVPWSNGNDTWVTSRKRWFNSIRDYLIRPRYAKRQSGPA